MDAGTINERYLKVQKLFGILVGVWPNHNGVQKHIGRFLIFVITVSSVVTQVARIKVFYSTDVMIEQSPFLVVIAGIWIKVGNYILNQNKLQRLLKGIYDDWRHRNEQEMDIMFVYAQRGAFFTSLYLWNVYICGGIHFAMALVPSALDIVMPLNVSRNVGYIYPCYYAVDDRKYYLLLLSHMFSVILTVGVTYTACDTFFVFTVQHACGLLAVSGYRFKVAVQKCIAYKEKLTAVALDEAYRKVCFSIHGHRRALNYIEEIQSAHVTYLFVCIGFVIASFSITLVKVACMELSVESLKYCGFLVAQLIHLLFVTIQGQFVINSYDEMYDAVYEGLWYNANAKTQALFVLVLRQSLRPPLLTAGGLMTLNLQSFSEIIKASVSYFTVLQSS